MRLPPFDDRPGPLVEPYSGQLSHINRRLNNLFAFSAIGTDGVFVPFQGLVNINDILGGLSPPSEPGRACIFGSSMMRQSPADTRPEQWVPEGIMPNGDCMHLSDPGQPICVHPP